MPMHVHKSVALVTRKERRKKEDGDLDRRRLTGREIERREKGQQIEIEPVEMHSANNNRTVK